MAGRAEILATIILGLCGLLYGLFTIYLRMKNPTKFGKLIAMQQKWGEKHGRILHIIG